MSLRKVNGKIGLVLYLISLSVWAQEKPFLDIFLTTNFIGDNIVFNYPFIEAARKHCLRNNCEVRLWGPPPALKILQGSTPKGVILKPLDFIRASGGVGNAKGKEFFKVSQLILESVDLSKSRAVYVMPGEVDSEVNYGLKNLIKIHDTPLEVNYVSITRFGPQETNYKKNIISMNENKDFLRLNGGPLSEEEAQLMRKTLLASVQSSSSFIEVEEVLQKTFPKGNQKPYIFINFKTSKSKTDLIADGKAKQIIESVYERYGKEANIVIANFDDAQVRELHKTKNAFANAEEFRDWLEKYKKNKPGITLLGNDDVSSGLVSGLSDHPKRLAVITADTGLGHIAGNLNPEGHYVISTNQWGFKGFEEQGKELFEKWKVGKNNYYTEVGRDSSWRMFNREVLNPIFQDLDKIKGNTQERYDAWMRGKLRSLLCL